VDNFEQPFGAADLDVIDLGAIGWHGAPAGQAPTVDR